MNNDAGLGARAVRGAVYAAAGRYLVMVTTFVGGIVLRKLAGTEPFGMVAYAAFIVALFGRVVEWGINQALIHRQEETEKASAVALTLYLLGGAAVLSLLLVAGAVVPGVWPEGRWTPETMTVAYALGVILFAELIGAVPIALLERELAFRRLTILEIVAAVVSTGIAICMAAYGWGVWAIVAWRAASAVLRTAGAWALSPHRPGLSLSPAEVRWFFRFGLPLWTGSLLFFVATKLNDFLVGTFAGFTRLGLYSTAFDYALVPLAVCGVLTRVSLPTYAKAQSDPERLSDAFRLNSRAILFGTVFLMSGAALVAPEFFGLIGKDWQGAAPLFRLLALYGIVRPLVDDCGGFLTAIGRTSAIRNVMIVEAVATVVLCPISVAFWGATGAALAADAVILLGLVLAYAVYVRRLIRISFWDVFSTPLIAGILSVGVAYLLWEATGLGHRVFALCFPRLVVQPGEVVRQTMLCVSLVLKGCSVVVLYPLGAFLLGGSGLREEIRSIYALARSGRR